MNLLHTLTATELLKLIRTKTISPEEMIDAHIRHLLRSDPLIEAWEFFDPDLIKKQLRKIQENVSSEAPLYTLPIGIKDIYNTFDMPTQMGSPLWKNFTPGNDARVVHYLRRNGAIVFGKTVTAEFAVHYQTKTKNPHDPQRSPGTSSSGSAAAVAANMVPLALGSQTAGSVNRPASYCGVYGYKPTYGVIPRIGILKTTDTLDNMGFFARSIDDLHLLFQHSRVRGSNYEFVHRYLDQYLSKPKPFYRIGVIQTSQYRDFDDYAKEQFETWLKQLQTDDIQVEIVDLPESIETIHPLHATIYDKSLAYYFKEEFRKHELISPIFYTQVERGLRISPQTYQDAIQEQTRLTQEYHRFFEPYDALVTLTTAGEAPIGLTTPERDDTNLIWTFLGMPSINIPLFKGPNQMPFGVLFSAKKYDDLALLELLKLLESRDILRNHKGNS